MPGNNRLLATLCCCFLVACSEEDSNTTTELEGIWRSQCFNLQPFNYPLFNTNLSGVLSQRIQHTYNNHTTNSKIVNYSDTSCTSEETLVDSKDSNFFAAGNIPVTFSFGDSITTADGFTAREIDFTLENGETTLNIYLIQDNTLYFGAIPSQCDVTGATLEERVTCWNNTRPDTINFSLGFAQNGEPVIIEPPPPTFGPPVIP